KLEARDGGVEALAAASAERPGIAAAEREGQVLEHGEMRKEAVALRHVRQAPLLQGHAHAPLRIVQERAADFDATGRQGHSAQQRAHERSLAGAVRTQHAQGGRRLNARDLERESAARQAQRQREAGRAQTAPPLTARAPRHARTSRRSANASTMSTPDSTRAVPKSDSSAV